jgi:hypothetical protein
MVGQIFGKCPVGKTRKRRLDAVREDSTRQRGMEAENQEGQDPLWAVVSLMMMKLSSARLSTSFIQHCLLVVYFELTFIFCSS